MILIKSQKPKIFCIGHNKTGTTTIESVLKDFGYAMGNQVKGDIFLDVWYKIKYYLMQLNINVNKDIDTKLLNV
ncbi:hypothetical protein [Xanthomarina gelatinilytica]|uniref:hypothetical protein n=1 Tax=Xanthomarina gelatinilytica TaxID=1137281 RepID=UPI003AA7E7B0